MKGYVGYDNIWVNPLNAELNTIRHLLALVEAPIKSHPPFASIGGSSN